MFCQNCGIKNEDSAAFCKNCGTRLEHEEPAAPIISTYYNEQNSAQKYAETVPAANHGAQRKISNLTKVILVEAVILMAAVYGLNKAGKNAFVAETVAQTFFVHVVNGNWEDAYEMLDTEESEFINAQMYAEANKNSSFDTINNYYAENEKTNRLENAFDVESLLGATVNINYRTKGASRDEVYPVMLNKQPDKKFLFFDDWKVATDNLIYTDFSIVVPEGASVMVDGVALTDKYLNAGGEKDAGYGTPLSYYMIPRIFMGSHTITVSMEDKNDVSDDIYISYYNSGEYRVREMYWSQEALAALMQKSGEYMQQLYSAAIKGQEFSSISGMLITDVEYLQDLEDRYEYLADQFRENEYSNSFLQNVRFHDIYGNASPTDGRVQLQFSYDVDYLYTSRWNSRTENRTYQDGNSACSITLEKEGGNWLIKDFSLSTLYY